MNGKQRRVNISVPEDVMRRVDALRGAFGGTDVLQVHLNVSAVCARAIRDACDQAEAYLHGRKTS